MFPQDPEMLSLELWDKFEATNPKTFASIYDFWVYKPDWDLLKKTVNRWSQALIDNVGAESSQTKNTSRENLSM